MQKRYNKAIKNAKGDIVDQERRYKDGCIIVEYKETDAEQTVFATHCHENYEMYVLVSGAVDYRVEGVVYTVNTGDILLLDRSRFHSVLAFAKDETYRRVVLQFPPELFYPEEQQLLALFKGNRILYPKAWNQGVELLFSQLDEAVQQRPEVKNIAIRTKIVDIMLKLFAISDSAQSHSSATAPIMEVVEYINAHLTESLTQEGLAERFFMSRNTLARGFFRATGSTVKDYILYKRMAMARILLQSGQTATEAAQSCGFADYSTFYRGYLKIFGQSPSAPMQNTSGEMMK